MKAYFFTTCLLLVFLQTNSSAQMSKSLKMDSLYSKGTFGISSMLFSQAPRTTVQQTVGEQYLFYPKRPITNYRPLTFSVRIPIKNNWGIGLTYTPWAYLNYERVTLVPPDDMFGMDFDPIAFLPLPRSFLRRSSFWRYFERRPEYGFNLYHIRALNEKIGILSSIGGTLWSTQAAIGALTTYGTYKNPLHKISYTEIFLPEQRVYIFSLDLRCQVAMRMPNMSVLTIGPWLHYNRKPLYSTFEFLEPAIENKGTIGRSTAFLGIEVGYELSHHALRYAGAYKKATYQNRNK